MKTTLKNIKVVDGSAWGTARNVEVKTIDIFQGTLKSTVATSYTLQPTYKDHEFMQEIGFSAYCYAVTIKFVEMVGNQVKLYSDKKLYENQGFGYITTLEMTDADFNTWSQSNQFITFMKDGEILEYKKDDDFDSWFEMLVNV